MFYIIGIFYQKFICNNTFLTSKPFIFSPTLYFLILFKTIHFTDFNIIWNNCNMKWKQQQQQQQQ